MIDRKGQPENIFGQRIGQQDEPPPYQQAKSVKIERTFYIRADVEGDVFGQQTIGYRSHPAQEQIGQQGPDIAELQGYIVILVSRFVGIENIQERDRGKSRHKDLARDSDSPRYIRQPFPREEHPPREYDHQKERGQRIGNLQCRGDTKDEIVIRAFRSDCQYIYAQQDAYAMADTVMERIAAVDGVETVGAMSGGSGMSSMMGGSSSGGSITYYILLSDDRTATNADVSAAIEAQVADLDCTVEVQESTMDMSALGGSGVELVITGRGLDEMNAIADDLRGILRSTEGLVDISENSVTGNPETRITVDKYKAMQHGLTVAQIYSELAAELKAENTATTLTLDGTDTPVVVVKPAGQAPTRGNIMDHAFTVTNAEGEEETVRLYDIAAKQETDSVSSINRENGARTMSVSAGVDARHNIGLVSRELEKKLADYELPEGYTVEIAGENETINSAMTDLVKMIALAVVFIYLIMVAQFQSLMSPFIVMFTIPLAFTGGLLALWLTGSELSIIAMLGFLVLAGVVVNNGIVFVDNINQLRLAGMDRTEAILETGRTRIRPVLMTALTTILAMSTMALGIGDGAEMTQPMAIVTIGGLTYATLLTLLVVPVLYDIFRKKPLYDPELDDAAADAAKELPQPAAG